MGKNADGKSSIVEGIFRSRDENSFTARLFEGTIFPNCYKSREFYEQFCRNLSMWAGKHGDKTQSCDLHELENTEFVDGMLFVECVDLYSFAGERYPDKTEFDAIIIASEGSKKKLIVFEVKCYDDLQAKELARQQYHLNALMPLYDYDQYFHIGLISKDNLENAKKIFNQINNSIDFEMCDEKHNKRVETLSDGLKSFAIVTWQDIFDASYLPATRFKSCSYRLPKTISNQCKYEENTRRELI